MNPIDLNAFIATVVREGWTSRCDEPLILTACVNSFSTYAAFACAPTIPAAGCTSGQHPVTYRNKEVLTSARIILTYNSVFGLNTQSVPPFSRGARPLRCAFRSEDASSKQSLSKSPRFTVSPVTPSMYAGVFAEYLEVRSVTRCSKNDFLGISGSGGYGDLIIEVMLESKLKKLWTNSTDLYNNEATLYADANNSIASGCAKSAYFR